MDLARAEHGNPGKLEWGGNGQRLSKVADELELEEDESVEGPVLVAWLTDENGDAMRAKIALAERIRNDNGHLRFSTSQSAHPPWF